MATEIVKTGNVLDDNRIIFMSGSFDEEKAKDIITKLFTLEAKEPTKDIVMYIDSYGGSVHSFLAIHDVIKMIRCDVATVAIGKTMSCGQFLLMSGTKGKRFATPNSRILIHEISNITCGKLTDMEIDINETKTLMKMLNDLIFKYTKIKPNELKKIMERDRFYSSEEALKLGLIDHVVSDIKQIYKIVKA